MIQRGGEIVIRLLADVKQRTIGPLIQATVAPGAIVFCFTSASIRITTSPVRWIIPKTGGFSFASVPRPGAPFSRRRRPGRRFS